MAQDARDAYLATLVQDINACASDALDALREGRLADVRTQIQAILDAVGEAISDIEEPAPTLPRTEQQDDE